MNNLCLHIIEDWFDPWDLLGPNGERPLGVKLLDPSTEFKRLVRQVLGSKCLIVVRFHESDQSLSAPKSAAQQWFSRRIGRMLAMTDPNTAFEGYNEIADGSAQAYAEFERERLRLMHAANLRAVVGNWSPGTPDFPTWKIYEPVLEEMGPGDFVGLHEYWADPQMLKDTYYCGRWEHVPQLKKLKPEQILITECGRAGIAGRGAPWLGVVDESTYVSELLWYAQMCAPRLAFVFAGGNTTWGWDKFDVSDIWGSVTKHYTAEPSTPAPSPEPPPSPPPPPAPEKIRLRRWLSHWDRWRITARFGEQGPWWHRYTHLGVDMVRTDGGTEGAAIYAPISGIVDINSWRSDRGWYIYLLDEERMFEVLFCHLQEQPALQPGDRVVAGQFIGHVGNTGKTTGPHLHVGVCRVEGDDHHIVEWLDPFGSEVEILE